jgi:Galactose oxidase, central domain
MRPFVMPVLAIVSIAACTGDGSPESPTGETGATSLATQTSAADASSSGARESTTGEATSASTGDGSSAGPDDTGTDDGAQPGPIDDVIAEMPENSWKRLAGTPMSDVCPTSDNHYQCDAIMNAWGGGAYDGWRDRLIVFGGGHNDSFYNNVFTFDLGTATWARHSELPAELDDLPDGGPVPDVFRDVRIENCGLYPAVASLDIPDAWLTETGYLQREYCDDPAIVAQLDPQQPRSTHTYGNIAFSPTTREFYNLGSSALYPSGQSTSTRNMSFDFDTGQWVRRADNLDIAIGAASATDGQGRIFYIASHAMAVYDPADDTWTAQDDDVDVDSYYAGAAVDTQRNRLLVTANGVDLQVFDLATTDAPRMVVSADGLAAPLSGQLGFEYLVARDRFVAWQGGLTVHWLDPDTYTWQSIEATGDDPGPKPETGIYGRFRYSPVREVLVVVTTTTSDVFIYKPPATAP